MCANTRMFQPIMSKLTHYVQISLKNLPDFFQIQFMCTKSDVRLRRTPKRASVTIFLYYIGYSPGSFTRSLQKSDLSDCLYLVTLPLQHIALVLIGIHYRILFQLLFIESPILNNWPIYRLELKPQLGSWLL